MNTLGNVLPMGVPGAVTLLICTQRWLKTASTPPPPLRVPPGPLPFYTEKLEAACLLRLLFRLSQDLLLSPKLNGRCEGKGEKCGYYLNGAAVRQVVLSLLRLQCLVLLRVYGQVASSLQNQT